MIDTINLIMFFILGLVMGSFYMVVGLRVPLKESFTKSRSHCERCGHVLKWYELIPVFSYLFLRGKCHNCKEKISIMYPFIELISGILFAISYYSFHLSYDFVIAIILVSLLILVIVSDLNYMIIPDSFIIVSSILIVIVKLMSVGMVETLIAIGYGIISFAIMYLIMLLGNFLFKKECLGGADIKLMFVVGLVLNPLHTILVIFIASFIALPVSLFLYFKNKEKIIPFGPFLVIGLLIMFFSKLEINDIIEFISLIKM